MGWGREREFQRENDTLKERENGRIVSNKEDGWDNGAVVSYEEV